MSTSEIKKNEEILQDSQNKKQKFISFQIINMSMKKGRLCINVDIYRSSLPDVLTGEGALKLYSKFTGKHPVLCSSVISKKLGSNVR